LDFAAVIRDLASRPAQVAELVQQTLDYTDYYNASVFGAGGMWFGAEQHLDHIVWQVQWPKDVTDAVIFTAPKLAQS
jgi:hypothetical protein